MRQEIDGIQFKMKEPFDFGFLRAYGKVFQVFDDQDSGNICFGTEKNGEKYFVKFAGARTNAYDGNPDDAVSRLKATVLIYENLKHKNLIEYVESKEIGNGFAVVFKWADGVCMGRAYPESHRKFTALPQEARLQIFADILDFMRYAVSRNFVAIDFYDGSILYDFEKRKTTVCDIDFFRKSPTVNDMGRMWGSARFMSPEEFTYGAPLDEVTNVYTLGALAFALFGNYCRDRAHWQLNSRLYKVAQRAVSNIRSERQQFIEEFTDEWNRNIEYESE